MKHDYFQKMFLSEAKAALDSQARGSIISGEADYSGTTAVAEHVLIGDKFRNSRGVIVKGSMPNNGAVNYTIDGVETKSVDIPKGYTSGGSVAIDDTIDNATQAALESISGKGVVIPSGADVRNLASLIDSIEVGSGDAGGSAPVVSVLPKVVNFYDYDGTVLYAYDKDEFLALTELPELPTRPGLICQGWNNTLEYMQEYTSEYGVCDAGAMYITDDGKTRIYITLHEGRTSPMLGLGVNGTVTVDWGDGTEYDVLTGADDSSVVYTPNHTYAEPGDYIIRLSVDGSVSISGLLVNSASTDDNTNRAYSTSINSVNIGAGITSIGNRAFYNCYSLSSVTIPNSITSIGSYAFSYCYSLSSVVIPDGVTSIIDHVFYYCTGLSSVTIPNSVTSIGSYAFSFCHSLVSVSIPNSVTSIIDHAFYNCTGLPAVIIPNSVTSIGSYAFSYCYSLSSVVIPNSVTVIEAHAFSYCHSLVSVSIPNSVTDIESYAFSYCHSLVSVSIPNSVTIIGSRVFYYCYSLVSVSIPNSVTTIGSDAFYNCYSLVSVSIPNGVTSLFDGTFLNCYSVAFINFSTHTAVPTLFMANTFSGIPADCKILVPAELYEEWIAAQYWSKLASKIVAV